jgi:hydroxyacylglutathione hydrolase
MIIKQFEVKGLAQFSYAIGCKDCKEIAIIDPERDYKTYLEYAAENQLKITHVLETHIHADYASGSRELAEKTGAELMLSAYDTNEKYVYQFPHTKIKEGDSIKIGNVEIKVLHTPGHTPEHISFLADDSNSPTAFFTGDFLFIGSLGRPDLLGEDDKIRLAEMMFDSVNTKLKNLSDEVVIYPGHGAGSLCGAGLSKEKTSDLGTERKTNPYLNKDYTKEEFVKAQLTDLPERPDYYLRMKDLNSEGFELTENLTKIKKLSPDEFADLMEQDDVEIIDTRNPLAYGGGHVYQAVNYSSLDLLITWGPRFISYEKPILIVLDENHDIKTVAKQLRRIGLDKILGYLDGGIDNWIKQGYGYDSIEQIAAINVHDMLEFDNDIKILDVRSEAEFREGHILNAIHIPLGELSAKIKEYKDKLVTVVTVCGGGYRSSIASGIISNEDIPIVYNMYGGMGAWNAAELPTKKSK